MDFLQILKQKGDPNSIVACKQLIAIIIIKSKQQGVRKWSLHFPI